MDKLFTSIEWLKGIGSERAKLIKSELGISTFYDMLHLFPNRYIDRTKYYKISELQNNNAEVQIIGSISDFRLINGKTPAQNRLAATFSDETGSIELVWFNKIKWVRDTIKTNVPYVICGKCNFFMNYFSMPHPEIETLEQHKNGISSHIVPVYPSSEKLIKRGISQLVFRKMIQQIFSEIKDLSFDENLPFEAVSQFKLLDKKTTLFNIHFPQNESLLAQSQFRLKFEELFFIQLQLVRKNLTDKQRIKGFVFEQVGDHFNNFYKNNLPFELTNAQKKVIKEIRRDLKSGAQMNRLLQGDVGSGKTIVSLLSMLIAIGNSFQATMLAPTEILATQHFEGISELLKNTNITVELLTGSTKTKHRREILENLQNGSLNILIGTHAILEEKVVFNNLGLVIIDEQHRFGVEQRSKLWLKNSTPPHVLVMSATPIPRTLAMSVYGDLDISIIDELPPGRKPIKTIHQYESNRGKLYQFIKTEIDKGRQVYIVYPLIEESEMLDFKNLYEGYENIKQYFPSPKYNISIVHGKLKPEEKEQAMQDFISGKSQIMVATTVIEVGVNVPNASLMIIESAERFGLSQLHQLRGRVGRGAEQSYCILMTGNKLSSDSRLRMDTMVATNDGFQIAEVDLKLRGPGDLSGTKQSGVLNLKIANILKDGDILKLARSSAIDLIKEDPNLINHQNVAITLSYIERNQSIWNLIS